MDVMPINIDVLKWARKTLSLSIRDVARRMKKSESVIREWETGHATPSYSQLEKLAYEIYKRPIAVFFFPNIPEEETPKTEFRALPDSVLESLPSEIIRLYRKAKIFQLNLAELFENSKPVDISLLDRFSLVGNGNLAPITNGIRNVFKFSIEDQISWRSYEIAFKKWRKAFEDNGIFVFKDAFHNNEYSGFCIYDLSYPVIFINNSMSDSRQIFTLFHELGHLLSHIGGIDFRDNRVLDSTNQKYLSYERNCNKFASEFLVPTGTFRNQDLSISERNITNLSTLYSVSREVIIRKLYELNLIDNSYYGKMVEKWVADAKKHIRDAKGGHYYYTQIAYLGNTYIDLVFKKYYQNKISLDTASDYLNIKQSKLSSLEHFAFGH